MVDSLQQRILDDLTGQILSGAWPPGYRIPFEHELTKQYNCSRMTVHRALTQLAEAGLITRRRRAGSFVTRPTGETAVLEIHTIKAEVEALGLPYSYLLERQQQRSSTAAEQQRLGLPATAAVLELHCRHFAGNAPFCLEHRLINLDAVPAATTADFATTAPGPWLLHHVPWSTAEHRIRAIPADATTAAALAVNPGTACLVIERRTWSSGQPVTLVTLTYVGDHHTLVAHFTPAGQP